MLRPEQVPIGEGAAGERVDPLPPPSMKGSFIVPPVPAAEDVGRDEGATSGPTLIELSLDRTAPIGRRFRLWLPPGSGDHITTPGINAPPVNDLDGRAHSVEWDFRPKSRSSSLVNAVWPASRGVRTPGVPGSSGATGP